MGCCSVCLPVQAGTISGTAEVVDGDGLQIGPVAIRIHGIDAPETGQDCARSGGGTWECDEMAAGQLAELVAAEPVECEALDRDAYGRVIARCWAGGADVAAALVREGLAWAYLHYSADYAGVEAEARAAGRGIWQSPTMSPWDYRADRWGRAAAAAPDGCPTKGNINGKGERIYHTPWSPWYARTRISATDGERWFCDEAAAVEAGWRAARHR